MDARSTQPLVWIDCEMSGLDPEKNVLLEVCCFITDHNLNLLEPEGFEVVLRRPKQVLDGMDEWCTDMHGKTGLTAKVLASKTSVREAEELLLKYIRKYVPEKRTAILAGNSVHADKAFLVREMPRVTDWLHYRIMDVSSVKEAAKRWCSLGVLTGLPVKEYKHEARADILESIEEMRYWKDTLFNR